MLLYIVIGLALIVVILLVVASTRPNEFRVQRSATLPASPAVVFGHVNDLHKWNAWSPWARMDPNAKNTFAGAAAGTGAIFSWAGNNKVGEGRKTIIESKSAELIRIKLEFFKPFQATNTAEFTFKAEGGQTVATWSMFGQNNFMAKVVSLFMDCEKMVGGQFEQGFANMKEVLAKN